MENPFADIMPPEQENQGGLDTNPFADILPPETTGDRTLGDAGKDLVAAFGKGSNALVGGVGGIYGLVTGDMDNPLIQATNDNREFYGDMESEGIQHRRHQLKDAIAGRDGSVGKGWEAFKGTITDPALLSSFAAEQVPMFAGMGLAGRGLAAGVGMAGRSAAAGPAAQKALQAAQSKAGVAGAIGTGAALQGSDVGTGAYERLLEQNPELWAVHEDYVSKLQSGLTEEQAKHEIALKLSRQAGLESATVSALVNLLPGAQSIERALVGAKGSATGIVRGAATGMVGEGAAEGIEEGYGQFVGNRKVHGVNPEQQLSEGVGAATGQGAVGMVFGGVGGAVQGAKYSKQQPKSSEQDGEMFGAAVDYDRAFKDPETRQLVARFEDAKAKVYDLEERPVIYPTKFRNELPPAEQRKLDGPGPVPLLQRLDDNGLPRPNDVPRYYSDNGQEVSTFATKATSINEKGGKQGRDSRLWTNNDHDLDSLEKINQGAKDIGTVPGDYLPDSADVRLLNPDYRERLSGLASTLQKGGGSMGAPLPVEFENRGGGIHGTERVASKSIRAPSENPPWFQEIEGTVAEVQNAVHKALTGKRLGKKQQRIIDGMLDMIADDDAQFDDMSRFGIMQPGSRQRYMYGGEFAKGADTSALKTAQQRIKAGEDPETVRRETGWHQGYDDKWKFEIDDSAARLSDVPLLHESKPLDSILEHPQLFNNYPELKDVEVISKDLSDGVAGWSVAKDGGIQIAVPYNRVNYKELKSFVLHEVQHAIQSIEDFAAGGSPDNITDGERAAFVELVKRKAKDYESKYDDRFASPGNEREFSKLEKFFGGSDSGRINNDIADRVEDGGNPLDAKGINDNAYYHLAGEIEARDVQARMDMTPGQRLNSKPMESQGIGRQDSILRYSNGSSAYATQKGDDRTVDMFGEPSQPGLGIDPTPVKKAKAQNPDDAPVSRQGVEQGTASWVIRNKDTGEVVHETNQESVAKKMNTDKYEAVPVQRHLREFNREVAKAKDKAGVKPADKKEAKKEAKPAKKESKGGISGAQAETNSNKVTEKDYPLTDEAKRAYSHSIRNVSGAAKVHGDNYVKTVNGLIDDLSKLAETAKQKTAMSGAVKKFKDDYISQEKRVLSARSGVVSSHIAGRSKFNSKQSERRGNALDKVEDDFSRFVDKAVAEAKTTVRNARTAEQKDRDNKQFAKAAAERKFKELQKEIARSIGAMNQPGMDKAAFRPALMKAYSEAISSDKAKTMEFMGKIESTLKADGTTIKDLVGGRSAFWKLYRDDLSERDNANEKKSEHEPPKPKENKKGASVKYKERADAKMKRAETAPTKPKGFTPETKRATRDGIVNIVNSKTFPKSIVAQMKLDNVDPAKVKGLAVDGKIYINKDHVKGNDDLKLVIRHEMAHLDMETFFGNKLNATLTLIAKSKDPAVKREFARIKTLYKSQYDEYVKREGQRSADRLIAEEVIAHFAEQVSVPNIIEKAIIKIRKLLKDLFGVSMPMQEVREILAQSKGAKVKSVKGEQRYMTAWHGSPHEFDKFTTKEMGAGEGAQAYGWGMYFAGNKKVAEWYREKLSGKPGQVFVNVGGKNKTFAELLDDGAYSGTALNQMINMFVNNDIKGFEKERKKAVAFLKERVKDKVAAGRSQRQIDSMVKTIRFAEALDMSQRRQEVPGALYQVDLKPKESEYLLWDKPVSEQSEDVKASLKPYIDQLVPVEVQEKFERFNGRLHTEKDRPLRWTGDTLYRHLSRTLSEPGKKAAKLLEGAGIDPYGAEISEMTNDHLASLVLNSLGVKGIKYLDGRSRNAGDGNYNYVIFHDDDVSVDQRYMMADSKIEKAAQQIAEEATSSEYESFGLRVIPAEFIGDISKGDILPASKRWVDGVESDTYLSGTSAIEVPDIESVESIKEALHGLGAGAVNGPNGHYFGNRVVLIGSNTKSSGEDAGEVLLDDAEVLGVWEKETKGLSSIQPNKSSDQRYSQAGKEPKKTLSANDPLLTPTYKKPGREKLQQGIVDELLSSATPVTDPVAVIMGGGGAAGKGTTLRALQRDGLVNNNSVHVDPDEIKSKIPEYSQIMDAGDKRGAEVTHKESSLIAERVITEATKQDKNLIIDKTLGNPAKALELIERIKSLGYRVIIYGVTVNPDTAVSRAIKRANETGRYVPIDRLREAHLGFSSGFERYGAAADEVYLYNNEGDAPLLIAGFKSGKVDITNKSLYQEFLGVAKNAKRTDTRRDQGKAKGPSGEPSPEKASEGYTDNSKRQGLGDLSDKSGGSNNLPSGRLDPKQRYSIAENSYQKQNAKFREEDKTLWNRAKTVLRRGLAPGGLLPAEVFNAKIARDSKFEAIEFQVRHISKRFEKAVLKAYGKPVHSLGESTSRILNEALGGKVDPSIPRSVVQEVYTMRQFMDGLSKDYAHILGRQIDQLKSGFDPAREILFDAFMAAADISPNLDGLSRKNRATVKAQATKQRNKIIASARDRAKLMWGDGKQMQQALSDVHAAASKASILKTIQGNIGQYVNRSYKAFDDPKWFKKIPDDVLNDARDYLVSRHMADDKGQAEAERLAEVTLNEIVKTDTAYSDIGAFIAESKLGAKDLSILKQRKDIAPEIRALLGEYVDPRVNFAKSATKMSRLIWNQVFLDKVKDDGMGVFMFEEGDRPPEATEKLAGEKSDTYSPLNGLWVTPDVKQGFVDAMGHEEMGDVMRSVIIANGLVKSGKTVFSPTTAMRNFQSAAFFAMANGHFNMKHLQVSIGAMKEYFTQDGDAGVLRYLKELKELGVVYDTPYAGEMMRLIKESKVEKLYQGKQGKAKRAAEWFINGAQQFYSFGDDFWKIHGYENEKASLIRSGMSEADAKKEAAKRIRDTYPTYSMTGRWVDWLRKNPLMGTFVSFPSEIVRTTINMTRYAYEDAKHPDRKRLAVQRIAGMATVSAAFYAAQFASKLMFGVDDDEEKAVREMAPPWSKNSTFWFTGRDAKGNLRYVDLTFLDPYGYFKRPFQSAIREQPLDDKALDVLSELVTPFLGTDIMANALIEVYANKRTGLGSPIYDPASKTDTVVKSLNHLRKAMQPGFVRNAEDIYKAGKGKISPSGKEYNFVDESFALVGWRVATMNPKASLGYRSYDFKQQLRDAKSVTGKILRNPNKVTDGQVEKAMELTRKRIEEAYRSMSSIVAAAQKSGLSDGQVKLTLLSSGVGKRDIAFLLRGEVPPYRPSKAQFLGAVKRARVLYDGELEQDIKARFKLMNQ